MKTKPPTSNSSGNINSSSSRSHTRKSSHSKDRDKKRSGPSGESGASSQCDTPPLSEKDSLSHGKYAGISPESVQCMAEQVLSEQLSPEVCTNLAEDVSYKLRQLIHNIALHARNSKIQRLDVDDVNSVMKLMDTEPVLGPSQPQWVPVGDLDNLCTTLDPVVDIMTVATQQQSYLTVTPPTLSTVWITDSKNVSANNMISSTLQNYYTRMSKAILSNNKHLVRVALNDLSTNTHIGPIVPNFLNLSILVLSEESLPVLAPTAHQMLHNQALNMVEALLINPCCADTDVTLQLQRLIPILVSNVLTESTLSEQMCRIMSAVTNTWPHLANIGRSVVLDYLSYGVEERLSAQLVSCLAALGRQALVDGLLSHLGMIQSIVSGDNIKIICPGMYEALLNAAHIFVSPCLNRFSSEMAYIDEMLYEILGDALIPHRIHCLSPEKIEESPPAPKEDFDEAPYSPPKALKKKSKCRIVKYFPIKKEENLFRESVFDVSNNLCDKKPSRQIYFNFAGSRPLQTRPRSVVQVESPYLHIFPNGNRYTLDRKAKIIIANGLLTRFIYKLPDEKNLPPRLKDYVL